VRLARTIGLTLLAAIVLAACGTTSRVAVVSPTASAAGPTSPASSSSPQLSSPPTASPHQPASCAFHGTETYAPSPPSTRNLAIVSLKGSNNLVVRDVTDINHATTVATLNVPSADPQFVGPGEVSWIWSDQINNLFRSNITTGSSTQVVSCPVLFDWSPDGTVATYVWFDGKKSELRQLARGAVTGLGQLQPFPQVGCESQTCGDNWQFRLAYSPDAQYIALIETIGTAYFRVCSSAGKVLYSADSRPTATAMVWSGTGLYFRDSQGVEVWHAGTGVTAVAPGVAWIVPHASPAGGLILYTVRDASSLPHVYVLDTATSRTRELAAGADSAHFLTPRYVWYEGVRLCKPGEQTCVFGPLTATGKTYIYDLQTGSTFDSIITSVTDTWPHAG
jgi:hypothetical protein